MILIASAETWILRNGRRLVDPFRQFGVTGGLLYLADRVMRRLSRRLGLYAYDMMVQPIHAKSLLPPSLRKHLEWREIRQGDPEIDAMPARPEIKESRFRQNARCIGAFMKGRLVGYLWYCCDRYEEDEVRCTYVLPEGGDSVFDFDLYVLPDHRMGIGFVAVWDAANAHLQARGVSSTFSRLTRFNTSSRRAHDHLGWKRIGRAVFVKAWSLEIMLSTLKPFLYLSGHEGNRVRLALRK